MFTCAFGTLVVNNGFWCLILDFVFLGLL